MRYLIVTTVFAVLAYSHHIPAQDTPKETSIHPQSIEPAIQSEIPPGIQKGELFYRGQE